MLIPPEKIIPCLINNFRQTVDTYIEDFTKDRRLLNPPYLILPNLSGTIKKHRMVFTTKGMTLEIAKSLFYHCYRNVASWCIHTEQVATITRKGNSAIIRFKPK